MILGYFWIVGWRETYCCGSVWHSGKSYLV